MIRLIRPFASTLLLIGFGCLSLAPPATANEHPWAKLTPVQREALEPLSKQWDSLPRKYQQDMLSLTQRYPSLTPEQKERLRSRLKDWNRLTPQQREQAREKYTNFSKVPTKQREEVRSIVRKQQAEKKSAASPSPQ